MCCLAQAKIKGWTKLLLGDQIRLLKGSIGGVSNLFNFFFYITIKNLLDRLKKNIITLNFRTPAVSFIKP